VDEATDPDPLADVAEIGPTVDATTVEAVVVADGGTVGGRNGAAVVGGNVSWRNVVDVFVSDEPPHPARTIRPAALSATRRPRRQPRLRSTRINRS